MSILFELSEYLCVEPAELLRFSASSPHRYKVYFIQKRNGKGLRTIAHPSKELKYVQRAIIELLQNRLPIHESAMAYKKGVNIKDNARCHASSSYLLKMDFSNFFPSINPSLFFNTLSGGGIDFTEEDKVFLKGILFWKPIRKGNLVLSIGAPTSPLVSNSLLFLFDSRISEFCSENNIVYTRYADDLTFSTNANKILFKVPDIVQKTLENTLNGQIGINREKTVFSSKAHNRHVTGVTITNDGTLSIGRVKKRNLSAGVHRFINDRLCEEEILSLQGKIAFSKYIEPEFYTRLETKYGHENMKNLMTYRKNQ